MKRFLILAAGITLAGCASTPATIPVYRQINLFQNAQVQLGQPLRADAIEVDDSTYALRPGTFGGDGTMAIVARVDDSNNVQAVLFFYDGTDTYDAKVQSYTDALGAPAEIERVKGASVHVWEDERTRLELHQDPGTDIEVWSVLRNLERSR